MTLQEQQDIFKQWLDQHKTIIFKIVRAYSNTAMDREDLFQEIALQVWRSIPRFRHESAIATWIYRIALNIAIRWVTQERKYRNTNGMVETVPDILSEYNTTVDAQLNWLYQAIHELDEIDRSVTLLLLDGFSYKEMADILGISVSNVGVKINRIKKHLMLKSKKFIENGI